MDAFRLGSIGTRGLSRLYKGDKLTQEVLKALVRYDPETGVFTRRVSSAAAKVGDVMGSRHNSGYLAANVCGQPRLLHRLAWLYVYGSWPSSIDHINHDRTDNRIANLREVNRTDNQRNQKRRKDSTSKVTGVAWDKARQKWIAKIRVNYKHIHLGRYADWFDAVCARKSAESRFGFHENHGKAA